MKGQLDSFFWDFKDKCIRLQMSVYADRSVLEHIEKLKDEQISVDIKKWAEKRSLTANAYFHVLVHKIAEVLQVSDARSKNILVGRYGQPEYIDGEVCAIKSNLPSEKMLEQEHLHCREVNGPDVECHYYVVYRQTRTYNSKEFARLLDGTISEAKELGIETLSPAEIERMKKQYGLQNQQ